MTVSALEVFAEEIQVIFEKGYRSMKEFDAKHQMPVKMTGKRLRDFAVSMEYSFLMATPPQEIRDALSVYFDELSNTEFVQSWNQEENLEYVTTTNPYGIIGFLGCSVFAFNESEEIQVFCRELVKQLDEYLDTLDMPEKAVVAGTI